LSRRVGGSDQAFALCHPGRFTSDRYSTVSRKNTKNFWPGSQATRILSHPYTLVTTCGTSRGERRAVRPTCGQPSTRANAPTLATTRITEPLFPYWLEHLYSDHDNLCDRSSSAGTVVVYAPVAGGVKVAAHGESRRTAASENEKLRLGRCPDGIDHKEGMGLGLSIARSLVETHGGRIEADNNAERGATFLVTLPAEAQQSSEDSPTVPRIPVMIS